MAGRNAGGGMSQAENDLWSDVNNPNNEDYLGEEQIGDEKSGYRALDRARIVVDRIDADASLFNVAHENLERWRRLHGTLSCANEEWEQILKRPWGEIREILLEESDEGQRLRSTHPFRGIVTEEKGLEIMRRHPAPWPYKPYATESVPPEVMEKILSEGIPERIDGPGSSQRRKPA